MKFLFFLRIDKHHINHHGVSGPLRPKDPESGVVITTLQCPKLSV